MQFGPNEIDPNLLAAVALKQMERLAAVAAR